MCRLEDSTLSGLCHCCLFLVLYKIRIHLIKSQLKAGVFEFKMTYPDKKIKIIKIIIINLQTTLELIFLVDSRTE